MPEKRETIFIEGLRFYKPKDGAPSWIKGNVLIDLVKLKEFVQKQNITDPIMRVDLCKSSKKENTYYFTLNTWKKPVEAPQKPEIDF